MEVRGQSGGISSLLLLLDPGRSSGKTASTFHPEIHLSGPETEFPILQSVSRFSFGMRSQINFANSSGHVNSER